MERASPVNQDEGFTRNLQCLHTVDYMESGLARLAKIPSTAYRASPAKRAGSCVIFSCNRFNTGLARQSGLRNLQRIRVMTRLYESSAKYFTARAGNPYIIVQIISALLGGPTRLTEPARFM